MFIRCALFLLALCPCCCQAATVPAGPEDVAAKLRKHVRNYDLGVSSFVGALVHLSNDFQIPMGIAWVNTPATRATRPLAWNEATIQQIIESIAKTQPGYKVQVMYGVLHVYVAGGIPESENFLRLQIKSFHVDNELTELASWKLHNLITPRDYSGFSTAANVDPRIDLDLKESTVERIFDAFVLASKRKIWVVTFSDDTNSHIKRLERHNVALEWRAGPR
jgi:hypothetical protein